jgi:DNA polymerase IIIc chi subunit
MGAAFFIETSKGEKDVLICKLAEYFCDHHQSAQIITGSINRAKYLDQLLWIFTRESFVPHNILDQVSDQPIIENIIVCSSAIYLSKFHNAIFDDKIDLAFMAEKERSITFVIRDDQAKLDESRAIWKEAKKNGISTQHISYFPLSKFSNVISILNPN